MKCAETRMLLSCYLDRTMSGRQMHQVEDHLEHCVKCEGEYALLQQTQRALASLGRPKAPADLALRVKSAVSQEAAKARRPLWTGFAIRLQSVFNAAMVPATAGVLSAIIFFGLLIGYFAMPSQLRGESDVPTMLYTPPELRYSPFEVGMNAINAESIVVEAYINAQGRVQDYRVLSAPEGSENLLPQLNNMLIFTVFRPATAFGQPTTGKAVLSFSKIQVKG